MKIKESSIGAKGVVSPCFVDILTGERRPFLHRKNTLSFASAEAMAAAFGGDPSYIPSKIGFIYGSKPFLPISSTITRNQTWNGLLTEMDAASDGAVMDIQVVGFSFPPTLGAEKLNSSVEGSDSSSSSSGSDVPEESDDYCNISGKPSNAITFHAVSNSQDAGKVGSDLMFINGTYIYQAVLLGYHGGTYHVLSRVSLKDSVSGTSSSESSSGGDYGYLMKPKGFEVALDWTIVFH